MGLKSHDAGRKNALPFCIYHELVAVSEDAARRPFKNHPHARIPVYNALQNKSAGPEPFNNSALMLLGRVNNYFFKWFSRHAVLFPDYNLRLGNLELVPGSSHFFKKNRNVK